MSGKKAKQARRNAAMALALNDGSLMPQVAQRQVRRMARLMASKLARMETARRLEDDFRDIYDHAATALGQANSALQQNAAVVLGLATESASE